MYHVKYAIGRYVKLASQCTVFSNILHIRSWLSTFVQSILIFVSKGVLLHSYIFTHALKTFNIINLTLLPINIFPSIVLPLVLWIEYEVLSIDSRDLNSE